MEYIEISAKSVNEAITMACQKLGVTSDRLDYEVIEEGSSGFLGIGSKPAIIKASEKVVKLSIEDNAKKFLDEVFSAMQMNVVVTVKYDEMEKNMDIDLVGDEMGVLIGKVDTENYRQRRRETLENLAKNIAYKVKRTKRPVSLEPMNPYERRIIHSALQSDRYVSTHSEGEEPFRRVVITLRR